MLALRTIKIYPILTNRALGRDFTVASGVHFATLMGSSTSLPAKNSNFKCKMNTGGGLLAQNNFTIQPAIAPFELAAKRFNSSEHHPTSKPAGWPEKPAGWPDKEQLERYEKYFFKFIAFIIDITRWSLEWAIRNFEKHVGKHPTVQYYWKLFIEKLENSRK